MLHKVGRVLRKPPGYVVRRALTEMRHELDRFTVPRRGREFDGSALARLMKLDDIDSVWRCLQTSAKPWSVELLSPATYDSICPGDAQRILAAADRACRHQIDLLGSGVVQLGDTIDWHRDYKTGDTWPLEYFRRIDYINKGRPSDVKTVWELSRMQWLVPAGQAYLLTGDERYASGVRDVLDQWILGNPYGCSVNWGVTMEPAMRIFTWTWFFHVFAGSKAWSDKSFRGAFLASLYLHGEFTERFIEKADVNGNHFTADAAALVVAGCFFSKTDAGRRWFTVGHSELEKEILLQVFPDGVDFEASVAYHRLVAECFLHASLWATCAGKPFSETYCARLAAMGLFTAAYTRADGSTPLWGDADDARVLPFHGTDVNDHRYLAGLIGLHLQEDDLINASGGSKAEVCWLLGEKATQRLRDLGVSPKSQAFHDGGFYIMRNSTDHVFIDCGPLGLSGRGGHGHNDLMSFEAMLDGELLIVDSGSYVYTASFEERNHFRSTQVHNTPQVDGQEVNRFISPDHLWNLHDDARPQVVEWHSSDRLDRIVMNHSGYKRLAQPVTPLRCIELDHHRHQLRIKDRFEGIGEHEIRIPLQLAPGVKIVKIESGVAALEVNNKSFCLRWTDVNEWSTQVGVGRVAPSYGVIHQAPRLEWSRSGSLSSALCVEIERC